MANKKVKILLTAVNQTKGAFNFVSKGLGNIGGKAKTAGKMVGGVGLAAAGAATALAALVKVNVDFMDKLDKTSSKLGIETDFLQNMRFAAEQTGVKVEALDMGLQRFIRRAAEAASGTGEAKRAFEQLGIQLKDSNGNLRGVELLMNDVADGIMNTADSAEQVRLAFKFFDSEGVSLVNTLKNGSKGLKEFKTEAENLGLIISKESIKKAAMFADSLNILKKQFTAITANLTAAFIPILQDASTQLSTMMANFKGNDKDFENFGKNLAIHVIEATKNATLAIHSFFLSVRLEFEKLKAVFGQGNPELVAIIKDIEDMEASMDHLNKTGQENSVFMENSKKRMAELREEFVKLAGKDGSQGIIDAFDLMTKKVTDFNFALEESKKKDPVSGMSETLSKFVGTMQDVNASIDKAAISSMKKFEDTIMDGLKNGKFAFQDFANFVVDQLLRIALQQMIIAPMAESLFGIIPKFDGGGYTGMGSRAGGVDGKGGFPAILHPNETVVDHTKGQSTGGGANITFNIQANDAAGFDQLLNSRKQMITAMINNAMNNRGKMGVV